MDLTERNINSINETILDPELRKLDIDTTRASLIELLDEDQEATKETVARRKRIRKLGERMLLLQGKDYLGVPNVYYIGPDVDNKKIIYVVGKNANLPISQMETKGKRWSIRKPRTPRALLGPADYKPGA